MNTINERDWAAKTALRLRIVQGTKLESESSHRGREVWEFISQALQELDRADADQRKRCMQALDEEFPFFESRPALNGAPDDGIAETGIAASDQSKPETAPAAAGPDKLIEQLVAAAAGLGESEREKMARRLLDAGFRVEHSSGALTAAVALPVYDEEHLRLKKTVERILDTLNLNSRKTGSTRDEVNLTRCMQMLGLMSEQYLLLHPQVWELWDHLVASQHYTTSFHRPSLPPGQALAEFLQGKSTTRRADVGDMVTKTCYLLGALITAVAEAGAEFGRWFSQKFGPDNIQSVMNFETDGSKAGPADYWKRYCDLAHSQNEDEMKEQFQTLLGKSMLRQLQRKPR